MYNILFNMKKIIVIVLLLLLSVRSNFVYAESILVDIAVEIFDKTPQLPGKGKAPIRIPRIYQDGYKLTLSSSHPEYIINIVQDDEVVYSSVIPAGVTEFELPSYLSGECTIQFIKGRFCFWGNISLQ